MTVSHYRLAAVTLALCAVAISGPPATAADVQEVTRDGVLHVLNPPQPLQSATEMETRELWRIGGDDEDDVVFGVIDDIAMDEAGNVYLLDIQLSEVLVLSGDGEILRTIGREGEGPGEFRRPNGMFVAPGGDIAVVQRMPGRIVLLTPDGLPAGTFPVPAPDDGVQFFDGAMRAGDGIVVAPQSFSRRETGFDVTAALIRVDAQGNQTTQYFEQSVSRDFASMEFDEKQMRGMPVWSAAPDGRVFVNDNFDAYSVKVWTPEGTVDRVIEREYGHRVRSDEEMQRRAPRMRMGRRGRHGGSEPVVVASKTDRDILQFFPREDGALWVLSGRGAFDAPDGAIASFDVFDAEGRFVRQVVLPGEGDYDEDGFHLVGDRLFVITGVRSARDAMRGAFGEGEEDQADEEVRALSVICYELGPIVQGRI
jgi:hypothetical protein